HVLLDDLFGHLRRHRQLEHLEQRLVDLWFVSLFEREIHHRAGVSVHDEGELVSLCRYLRVGARCEHDHRRDENDAPRSVHCALLPTDRRASKNDQDQLTVDAAPEALRLQPLAAWRTASDPTSSSSLATTSASGICRVTAAA